jgi:hypothetical protein
MQVISEAFMLTMSGIWELESKLLGMLEGAMIRYSYIFFQVNNQELPAFSIFRLRRLHLTCSVNQSSWGFFGGSIGTSENSYRFIQKMALSF